jgi:hypothetical protein
MEIICECGHRLNDHDESQGGCWYHYFSGSCYCNLSPETVEARYWAKYYYKKYNTTDHVREDLFNQYWTLAGVYIKTKRELDNLVEKWNDSVSKVYDEKHDLEGQVEQLNSVLGDIARHRDSLLENMEEAISLIRALLVDAHHVSKSNFKKTVEFIHKVE